MANSAMGGTSQAFSNGTAAVMNNPATLTLMGEHGAAGAFFARANQSQPNFPPFIQNLANNLVYHGETEDADTIFRDIIKLQPDSPQAHTFLGHIEGLCALTERGEHLGGDFFVELHILLKLRDDRTRQSFDLGRFTHIIA